MARGFIKRHHDKLQSVTKRKNGNSDKAFTKSESDYIKFIVHVSMYILFGIGTSPYRLSMKSVNLSKVKVIYL